jgi:hypothetical protein
MDEPTKNKAERFNDILIDFLTLGGILLIGSGTWITHGLGMALIVTGSLAFALGVFSIIWSTR